MSEIQEVIDLPFPPETPKSAIKFQFFPPAPLATCKRCEGVFPFDPKRGRPRAYCSPKCRRSAKLEQTAGWKISAANAPEAPPEKCSNCDRPLSLRAGGQGRFKRFCGAACRKGITPKSQAHMDLEPPKEDQRRAFLEAKRRKQRRAIEFRNRLKP